MVATQRRLRGEGWGGEEEAYRDRKSRKNFGLFDAVKINGGMSEMSESEFQLEPRTHPLLYFFFKCCWFFTELLIAAAVNQPPIKCVSVPPAIGKTQVVKFAKLSITQPFFARSC